MKCISLHLPWAIWVIRGWKPIETRTHERFASLVGERVGIHASKRWDPDWIQAIPFLSIDQLLKTVEFYDAQSFYRGFVLGSVVVGGHRKLFPSDSRLALIECESVDRYGLMLSDPKRFAIPIAAVGRQGIFHVDVISQ